jgi:hypothetical protein
LGISLYHSIHNIFKGVNKMSEAGKKRKLKTEEDTVVPTATPAVPQLPPEAPPAPVIPQEVRDELTAIMQELLLKTHELSFEYSTLDCEEIQNCPLAKKSREIFKVVKHLNELVKKMAPPSTKPTYVR